MASCIRRDGCNRAAGPHSKCVRLLYVLYGSCLVCSVNYPPAIHCALVTWCACLMATRNQRQLQMISSQQTSGWLHHGTCCVPFTYRLPIVLSAGCGDNKEPEPIAHYLDTAD
jgi:hypothetical protein